MLKKSNSFSSKIKISEKEPRILRKNVSSAMEIRMSPLPPSNGKYLYIPKGDEIKNTAYVKILKRRYQPVVDNRRYLEGVDKISYERHNPGYQNNIMEYKRNHSAMIIENKVVETPGVLQRLEEHNKKILERYQKLFASPTSQGNQHYLLKNMRDHLADMRVPKHKGSTKQFYTRIRSMLDKVE